MLYAKTYYNYLNLSSVKFPTKHEKTYFSQIRRVCLKFLIFNFSWFWKAFEHALVTHKCNADMLIGF